jgi:MFS family permease
MTSMPPTARGSTAGWGAWLLAVIFLVIAALIFAALYYAYPGYNHWYALIGIGIVALVFSVGSYFAEAASRQPTIQRSLAWGFFGMGFAVLLITVAIGPMYSVLGTVPALIGLVIVLAALFLTVGLMMWRVRSVARTAAREAPREAWRQEPTPSAFSYSTATSPSVPAVTPPPPPAQNSPPRSP